MKSTSILFLAFLFLSFTFFSLNCKKSNQPARFALVVHSFISVKSVDGADLLNPQNSGSIKADDIDIYYLKDGKKERIFNSLADFPENFRIVKNDNSRYSIKLFVSEYPDSKSISTTYIEFKDRGTDTITAEIVKTPSAVYFTKLWHNSALKWGGNNEQGIAHFDIVK